MAETQPVSQTTDAQTPSEVQLPALPPAMVPVSLNELALLTQIAQRMVQGGMLIASPPRILTAISQQDHSAAISRCINEAGQLAMQWGLLKGIIQEDTTEPPPLVTT